MAKITKKQYTRRALFAGVVIFLVTVLLITGVAIWLLFSSRSASTEGGITVGEVSSSPLAFSSLMIDGEEVEDGEATGIGFIFDSLQGDDFGRVTWNGTDSEKLSITVSGVVVNAQHLAKFSYVLSMPQCIKDAAAKGYIDISDFYDEQTGNDKEIALSLSDVGEMVPNGSDTEWVFSFQISLKWGAAFNNLNPSVFYDQDGIDIPLETVTATLNDLHNTVMGTSNTQPKYTLTLTASSY